MKTDPIYVSICLPAYNRADQLGATIRSVLENEYPYFELIIIDNASTDETPDVISSFDDERIRAFRNEETVKAGENWNIALGKSRYDLTLMVHSDDELDKAFLGKAVQKYRELDGKVPVVIGQGRLAARKGGAHIFPTYTDGKVYKAGEEALLTVMSECPHPCVQLVEKRCYEEAGYYITGYYEENMAEEIFGRLYSRFDFVFVGAVAMHLGGEQNPSKTAQIGLKSWTRPYFISRYARMKWEHLALLELDPVTRMDLFRHYVARACKGIFYPVFRLGHRKQALHYIRTAISMDKSILFEPKSLLKMFLVFLGLKF